MNEQDRMNQALALRSVLFDIANSFGGDKTGHVAIDLHSACNYILYAYQDLNKYLGHPNPETLPDVKELADKIKSAIVP
jgi:hypothetical protein